MASKTLSMAALSWSHLHDSIQEELFSEKHETFQK